MAIQNADIAALFEQMADLLDIQGADSFRVRAYRNGAYTVENYGRSLASMVAAGEDLTAIPNVGKALADKIVTIVETGRLPQLEELAERTPLSLLSLLRVEGLGPRRVQMLYEGLGITTLQELEAAAREGRVRDLEGFGDTLEKNILKELARQAGTEGRIYISEAERIAEPLVAYLKQGNVGRVAVAGSYRRRRETVGDLDVLVTSEVPEKTMARFVTYGEVAEVVSQGSTRSTVHLHSGLQVDLRVVPEESYGAALCYFTGSKAHNVVLRGLANDRDLKLNEYGLLRGEERIAGDTEEGIYAALDLPWIPPVLREDRGEVQAAREGRLPDLVTLEQIRGDLHMHATDSDGTGTIEQMARQALALGYEYIAITDHSPLAPASRCIDAEGLLRQIDEIDRLNEALEGIRVLKAIEVDIREDGSLDLPDDVLSRLDLRVCSVHTAAHLSREKQTERILRAMDNPLFNILGHPTGRVIGQVPAMDLDMEAIMRGALERGCYLELNARPKRLDLDDVHARMARDLGLKVAISTDAHTPEELALMHFGIGQAQRGWLTAEDVLNTRPLDDLLKLLAR